MEWNDMKEQVGKKDVKYVIRNGSTGKYLCDSQGSIKFFSDMAEAKMCIRTRNLSSTYCICVYEEGKDE